VRRRASRLREAAGHPGGLRRVEAGRRRTPITSVRMNTTAGTQTSPMQVLNWLSTGSDSIPVSWPRVANGTDAITYDVIRMTTAGGIEQNLPYPYNGGCPGDRAGRADMWRKG